MKKKRADRAEKAITQAENQLAKARINVVWNKECVDRVCQVAAALGVSAEDYIKLVVARQTLIDLALIRQAVS